MRILFDDNGSVCNALRYLSNGIYSSEDLSVSMDCSTFEPCFMDPSSLKGGNKSFTLVRLTTPFSESSS